MSSFLNSKKRRVRIGKQGNGGEKRSSKSTIRNINQIPGLNNKDNDFKKFK